jgi:hypothetical protein
METVWDVSNEEGTALEPGMLNALRLLVGDVVAPRPGSLRGDNPVGAIVDGPTVDAARAKQLLAPPTPKISEVALRAAAFGAPKAPKLGSPPNERDAPPRRQAPPSQQQTVAAAASGRKALVSLTLQRTKTGGVQVDIARPGRAAQTPAQPAARGVQRVAVDVGRPAEPGGEWVRISVLKNGAAPTTTRKASGGAAAVAAAGDSQMPVAVPMPSGPLRSAAERAAADAPMYRSTVEDAAMQHALRHTASGGHAEQGYLFLSGRLPWMAAVAAAAAR